MNKHKLTKKRSGDSLDHSAGNRVFPAWRLAGILFLGLAVSPSAQAATIWHGPLVTYTQPGFDPTQAANQDHLTPNVSLTRASVAGLFNGVTEAGYTKPTSPADTEWAVGELTDAASLVYTNWQSAGAGNPVHNLPGQQLVLHLISDDIYLSVKFTALGGGGAGGFSYIRSTPSAVVNNPPSVTLTNPTDGTVFAAPATVTLAASADDSDGTVTNVEFFDGAVSIGNATASPYTISTNLASGSHALSAVASDDFGATATNTVTVSVVEPVPVNLDSPTRPALANFQFTYTANPGLRYIVQRSTNLAPANWTTLVTNLAGGSSVNFTDMNATVTPGFYRVGRLPNP